MKIGSAVLEISQAIKNKDWRNISIIFTVGVLVSCFFNFFFTFLPVSLLMSVIIWALLSKIDVTMIIMMMSRALFSYARGRSTNNERICKAQNMVLGWSTMSSWHREVSTQMSEPSRMTNCTFQIGELPWHRRQFLFLEPIYALSKRIH